MAFPIGLAMIVKDEEENIGACLETVAGLVGEMVVVDTGSTDQTRELAKRNGAKVVDFPWTNDFSAARNAGLQVMTAPWIIWMDADDRLDGENRERLKGLFGTLPEGNVGYIMKCVSPREPGSGRATVTEHVRLFRNFPEIRWEGRVHEQIRKAVLDSGGELRHSDVVIHHTGYETAEIRREKAERNLRLLLEQRAEEPGNAFVLYNIGHCYLVLERKAEAFPFFQQAYTLAPPDAPFLKSLYVQLVDGLYNQKRYYEALELCRRGLTLFGPSMELMFIEASLAVELGDLFTAERLLRHWLSQPVPQDILYKDPLLPVKARQNLACIDLRLGRLAEGEQELRKLLLDRPDYLPAWEMLEQLLRNQGRFQEAEYFAERSKSVMKS